MSEIPLVLAKAYKTAENLQQTDLQTEKWLKSYVYLSSFIYRMGQSTRVQWDKYGLPASHICKWSIIGTQTHSVGYILSIPAFIPIIAVLKSHNIVHWCTKLNNFAIWFFKGKVCQPQLQSNCSQQDKPHISPLPIQWSTPHSSHGCHKCPGPENLIKWFRMKLRAPVGSLMPLPLRTWYWRGRKNRHKQTRERYKEQIRG